MTLTQHAGATRREHSTIRSWDESARSTCPYWPCDQLHLLQIFPMISALFFFGFFFFFFTIYYAWHCLGLNETRPNAVGGVIGGG
jgi:hypothetical protein